MDRVAIALDLFPADMHVQSTTYHDTRVTVADGELVAYRLGASGPEVTYRKPVTGPIDGAVSVGLTVPTEDGPVLVEQSGDCGCGSALKTADLWPGRQKVMTGLR